MQQWEYLNLWVTEGEREFETGEKGFLGGSKKETRQGWWARVNGQEISVSQALSKLGTEGWELVSAVVSEDYYPANVGSPYAKGGWYKPAHWLYFKRPKSA